MSTPVMAGPASASAMLMESPLPGFPGAATSWGVPASQAGR
ncbi:hypothetical protein ACFXPA_42195 [Amycolatopsis sp. NPDC059090]